MRQRHVVTFTRRLDDAPAGTRHGPLHWGGVDIRICARSSEVIRRLRRKAVGRAGPGEDRHGVGRIVDKQVDGDSLRMWFTAPANLLPYIVVKGYISLDGVSLTFMRRGLPSGSVPRRGH